MEFRQPNIEEMVIYLNEKHPDTLAQLRAQFPDYAEIMRQTPVLGETGTNKEELRIRATFCLKAIEAVLKDSDVRLNELKNRLKLSANLVLTTKIIAAVSSAGVVATLIAKFVTATYITGSLSFIANIISIIVSSRNKLIVSKKEITTVYVDIQNFKSKLESYQSDLAFFVNTTFSVPGIIKIVNNSNLTIFKLKNEIALI